MSGVLARWRAAEPVRLYLYSVGTAVTAVLVVRGVVTGLEAPLLTALLQVLLMVPAVETARGAVTSPATASAQADELRAVARAATTGAGARQVLLHAADTVDPAVPPARRST